MIMSAIDIVNRYGGKLDEDTVRQELEGQYLPLHRLPQYRQIGARRRRPHERCTSSGIVPDPQGQDFRKSRTGCDLRPRLSRS
jgi:hypothetical protein